ncbi:MAG: methyltransferase domain-containing protein [Candidatus Bathyarchaeota archaeon]
MSLAPFVASPPNVVTEMLQLANIKRDETLFDLGCGDGRIILEAATKFGAKAVGVELDEGRYRNCVKRVQEAHLENRVQVIYGDLLHVDLKKADVITLYLLTSSNEKIKPNLERDLKKGARVVSHDFQVTGWTPTKVKELKENWGSHTLYLYTL